MNIYTNFKINSMCYYFHPWAFPSSLPLSLSLHVSVSLSLSSIYLSFSQTYIHLPAKVMCTYLSFLFSPAQFQPMNLSVDLFLVFLILLPGIPGILVRILQKQNE